MSGPNPLSSTLMSPQERRTELCKILARGVLRLKLRDAAQVSEDLGESSLHFPPDQSGHANDGEPHDRPDPRAPGRAEDHADARAEEQWRDLFDTEPPPFNRRYLESRLAYRIQELAYGGLKPETIRRLEALGEQFDGGNRTTSRIRADAMPIAGTRLVREWQGVEHTVTVPTDGYEWQGRPYRSLSAIARAITGTRWNGWVFFGLKNHRGAA